MKFIRTNELDQVTFIHYKPFDQKYGIGKSEDQLREEGYLIEEIPSVEHVEGKTTILYYNEEKGFWFEYVDTNIENTE